MWIYNFRTNSEQHQLVYHATASHLLAFPLGEVALIDSSGSFSPLRLRDVLVFRLEAKYQRESYQQSGYMYEKTQPKATDVQQGFIDQATIMLDRVKVMRVFDFAGVIEAVSELSDMRERTSQMTGKAPDQTRNEVDDSEEELDEDDKAPENLSFEENGQIGLIAIDSITNVVNSVMSRSQTQGQALLANFMRSLHFLTSRHHICTLLTNTAVGLATFSNAEYRIRPEDNASVFSSILGKPALGMTFTYLIDTSILLSTIPKTTADAAIAYGDKSCVSTFRKAVILEVLKDRCGSREGRWAAIEVVDEVKIVPCYS